MTDITTNANPDAFKVSIEGNKLFLEFANIDPTVDTNLAAITHTVVLDHRIIPGLISTLQEALAEPKLRRDRHINSSLLLPSQGRDELGNIPVNLEKDIPTSWSEKLKHGIQAISSDWIEERSFKISADGLDTHRFLLGLERSQLQELQIRDLSTLLQELGMPNAAIPEVEEKIGFADWIHLGFEATKNDIVLKLYLEKHQPMASSSYCRHHAWKWSINQSFFQRSEYIDLPDLSQQDLKEHIYRITSPSQQKEQSKYVTSVRNFCLDLCSLASNKHVDEGIEFLEVSEPNTFRMSFDLGFYGTKLKLGDIESNLKELFEDFAIPSHRMLLLLEQNKSYQLGHVAAGFHRNGEPFCTIYYGANNQQRPL
jgi:hypothetical protein